MHRSKTKRGCRVKISHSIVDKQHGTSRAPDVVQQLFVNRWRRFARTNLPANYKASDALIETMYCSELLRPFRNVVRETPNC